MPYALTGVLSKKLVGREFQPFFIEHFSQTPENGVEYFHISQVRTVKTAILSVDNTGEIRQIAILRPCRWISPDRKCPGPGFCREKYTHTPLQARITGFLPTRCQLESIMGKIGPTPGRETRGCIDFGYYQVQTQTSCSRRNSAGVSSRPSSFSIFPKRQKMASRIFIYPRSGQLNRARKASMTG